MLIVSQKQEIINEIKEGAMQQCKRNINKMVIMNKKEITLMLNH